MLVGEGLGLREGFNRPIAVKNGAGAYPRITRDTIAALASSRTDLARGGVFFGCLSVELSPKSQIQNECVAW